MSRKFYIQEATLSKTFLIVGFIRSIWMGLHNNCEVLVVCHTQIFSFFDFYIIVAAVF